MECIFRRKSSDGFSDSRISPSHEKNFDHVDVFILDGTDEGRVRRVILGVDVHTLKN
jgi:hypothetical protein